MKIMRQGIAGLAVLSALSVSPAVLAQDQEPGWYVGGAYGKTVIKGGGCGELRNDLASIGATVTACDDKDSGWKIFAGYRVNRHFAVEASYIDFGSLTASATRLGVNVNASGDVTSFGVAAVGILPVGERFSVFGKAGLLITEMSARASGSTGGSSSNSDSQSELHYGVGAMFNLSSRWALRAEWERAEDSEVEMISIGIQYRF
jgi:OmpA-OmpF porin, OOP family